MSISRLKQKRMSCSSSWRCTAFLNQNTWGVSRGSNRFSGSKESQSTDIVEPLLELIKSTLASGEDVLISGFSKFCVKEMHMRRVSQTKRSLYSVFLQVGLRKPWLHFLHRIGIKFQPEQLSPIPLQSDVTFFNTLLYGIEDL
jgi:hypothetical protein